MGPDGKAIAFKCNIKCPRCSFTILETMPADICQYFYDCRGCGRLIRPWIGDCCVYCSHGDVPCPPVQIAQLRATYPRRRFKLE
ncbi:MAG TPA: GDCCVxC domain-containing (seleno)protein [Sphingomicrobium sp.]|nr:GDCCVxC domain-containing (seleno)protein [Sphingomicrobium sp.]